MSRSVIEKTPVFIAGLGGSAAAVTYVVSGSWIGLSAAIGAVLAVVNWYLYRWIIGRVMGGNVRQQSVLMLLLVVKMGALMGLIFLLISRQWVDAVGFLIGISALVVGLMVSTVRYLASNGPLIETIIEDEREHAPR